MQSIGKYTVIKQLGAGGFGAVYLAEDKLGEQVAIKVFQVRDENLARQATSSSTDAVEVLKQRFLTEARTLRKLSANPYIVEMYDFDELDDGTPYYVMPYLEKSLEAEIGKDAFTRGKLEETPPELHPRRLPTLRALALLEQVLEGLAAVHKAGLIHRDIKPANVLLGPDGQVQICDFGIAKVPDVEHSMSGVGMGSRNYMSPEQRESAKYVEPQSDVYAVGVMAFRMLTGTLPTLTKQSLLEFAPEVGEPLATLIDRAMELDPQLRPRDGGEFLKQLRKARAGVDTAAADTDHTGTFTDVGRADDIRDELRPLKERIETLLGEKGALDDRDREVLQTLADVVELDAQGLEALITQVIEQLSPESKSLVSFVTKLDARAEHPQPLSDAQYEGLLGAADALGIERTRAEQLIEERFAAKRRSGSGGSTALGHREGTSGGLAKVAVGVLLVAVLCGGGYWFYTEQQTASEQQAQQDARDAAAFELASRRNTEASYQSYLDSWPSGRHALEATERLVGLEDDAAFAGASSTNTVASYRSYLETWPEGRHRGEAEEGIALLERAAAAAEQRRLAAQKAAEEERLAAERAAKQAAEAAAQRKALVMSTQQELNRLGYQVGTADGVIGPATTDAIKTFEYWSKRRVTGEPSEGLLTALRAADKRPVPQAGDTFRDRLKSGGQGPELVVLPTARFQMGCVSGQDCRSDEQPVRTVTISRLIAMMKHEVTFAAYDRFAEAVGRDKPDDEGWGRGNRPVINVSWEDAQAYARWLSEETGKRYRLPTEAEWEYAARAGTKTTYSWGSDLGRNRANCNGCGSRWDNSQTAPVGSFAANPWGLQDMQGNVWEWVEDCYDDSYVGAPSDGSAKRACGTQYRVLRGGSWTDGPGFLRSALRDRTSPSSRYNYNGFRLVQDLDP